MKRSITIDAMSVAGGCCLSDLPDCVLSSILIDADKSVRLVSKQMRLCKDAPLSSIQINGSQIAMVPDHFSKAAHLLGLIAQQTHVLSTIQIKSLPSFGSLSMGLPPCLFTRLRSLELSDCEVLFRAGDRSLVFHLKGISALVNLNELRLQSQRSVG